ncbi:hypothetical protein PWEIH_00705 [Listeria weihenstephanensis FSL R9-0317]|uniref:Uncharacterized protein n=2 Tax=Listeria weihenstephanensis TaxID=1006155 RepID=A0A1S7FT26_9LIST|nr:hypothetical protein [Listeria weihenstephanensis]AQY50517.1 hypothetical protein UE46_05390 [Listeria phage LWP01] [Listeria weihenstephanensis]AQY52663.1 hypothetical protein UE46_p05390 [Listeria phage LWP01]EUJ41537.1 hypothetical protein PWEIH_00705 [Listeria weihenstephanensis FSL R9-0317]
MGDIVTELVDEAVTNDRAFYILTIIFMVLSIWALWILFRHFLRQLTKAEERAESKQSIIESQQAFIADMRLEHQEHMRSMQTALAKSQTINENLVTVTAQQQRYIEGLKAHRRTVENMDRKIDKVLLKIAEK